MSVNDFILNIIGQAIKAFENQPDKQTSMSLAFAKALVKKVNK